MNEWTAIKCSKTQINGDWFIARKITAEHSNSHFEQMRDGDGVLMMFKTEAQARQAINEHAKGKTA